MSSAGGKAVKIPYLDGECAGYSFEFKPKGYWRKEWGVLPHYDPATHLNQTAHANKN
jgi:hypothetical protein